MQARSFKVSRMTGKKERSKGDSPYKDIPREKIPWHPTVDEEKCTGCGTCVDFCHSSVYSLEEKAKVASPFKCIVGCTGCFNQCPENAISFPDMKEFVKVLQKLKAEHAARRK